MSKYLLGIILIVKTVTVTMEIVRSQIIGILESYVGIDLVRNIL